MPKEQHPYLHHFDLSKPYKFLIIGTFPPKKDCPNRTDLLNYFYGNEGSLWQIIKATNLYPDFNFETAEDIQKWQIKYSVAVTDVIKQCSRVTGKECSPSDKNLIIDEIEDLNHELKAYILKYFSHIEKFYFTSGSEEEGGNSAFWLFTKLMENDLAKIDKNKIIKLPSPSGEFLRTVFSKAKTNFGLKPYFFEYLKSKYPEALEVAEKTFNLKLSSPKTKITGKGKIIPLTIPRFPGCPNYPSLYRLDEYKKLMPQ